MSKFLVFIQENIKKQRLSHQPNFWSKIFNTRILNITVLVMVCLAGVFYLAIINSMTIKGFKIKELEEKQARLKENLRQTEFQIAELQSMQKVEERIANLNMVTVTKTEYVSPTGSVAIK